VETFHRRRLSRTRNNNVAPLCFCRWSVCEAPNTTIGVRVCVCVWVCVGACVILFATIRRKALLRVRVGEFTLERCTLAVRRRDGGLYNVVSRWRYSRRSRCIAFVIFAVVYGYGGEGGRAETAREMMTAGTAGRTSAPTTPEKRKRRERVARPREYNKIIVSALL